MGDEVMGDEVMAHRCAAGSRRAACVGLGERLGCTSAQDWYMARLIVVPLHVPLHVACSWLGTCPDVPRCSISSQHAVEKD